VLPCEIALLAAKLPCCGNHTLPSRWAQGFTDALSIVDINTRAMKTRALQKMIYDDATVVCLYLSSLPIPIDKSVHDNNFYNIIRNMFTPEKRRSAGEASDAI